MEKFGLFDLIDKFNAVANGKNDFVKDAHTPKQPNSNNDKFQLVDPKIPTPTQYLMNAKMLDFCKKHDQISKKIITETNQYK